MILGIVLSFSLGYYTKDRLIQADQANNYKRVIETYKANDEHNRQVVQELQTSLESKKKAYNKLTEELKHVKIYNSKCNITVDGLRLWNDSLKGSLSSVPKDTSRASKTSESTNTVTVNDLFENKLKNDEICDGLRLQLDKIIQWDKETWHDTDSTRN